MTAGEAPPAVKESIVGEQIRRLCFANPARRHALGAEGAEFIEGLKAFLGWRPEFGSGHRPMAEMRLET